ncbi:MAG: flagellar motor switch protein FliM [Deltaproteobacteria bacterium]|jgi:flagellar motor switch protein FliM|nr:flagellar motor switch protein FliM [Deltaproteobacteria bacterium]
MDAGPNILTQAEVDALLRNIDGDPAEPEPEDHDAATGVVSYDLTSQDRIVRGRMPTLEIINDRFARFFQQSMSTSLRKMIAVSVSSIDMIKFGVFMRALPVPTSLHVFKAEPLRGHAIMVLESKLAFSLIDSFFGGSGRGVVKIEGRDFTPLETRRIMNVIKMALSDLEKAWYPVHPLTFTYVRGESNPQFASVVAPTEVVLVIKFEVELEQAGGILVVCLPYSTIEPIRSKLYAGFQSDQLEVDTAWISRFIERVREAEVTLTVELGRSQITAEELLNLAPGDCIKLNHDVREPLEVKVEGVPKFKVFIGSSRGQKAVKIETDIAPRLWED